MRKRNYFICSVFCCILSVSMLFGGCGNKAEDMPSETIELREPKAVSIATYTEAAAFRNLYSAELYEANVSPYVEEYSFNTSQLFDKYCILPGEEVKQGDVLVKAIGDTLSSKIEAAEETLEELQEDYEKYCREAEETLSEQRRELELQEQILENLEAEKPQEHLLVSGEGQITDAPDHSLPDSAESETVNPDYLSWKAQYDQWEGERDLTYYYISVGERELQLQQDLFNLDYNYYNNRLKKLLDQRQDESIISRISGTVVGIGNYVHGDQISDETPVIAVGDTSRKMIDCSFVAERTLTRACDVYAFVNGERYEVTKTENGSYTRSLFLIEDENDEIPMGAYAVLVVMSDSRQQVLSVPVASIYRENSADYVYVMKDGEASSRKVEKGMSDGLYVEILSGLQEGEEVVIFAEPEEGSSSIVLTTGNAGVPYQIRCKNVVLPMKTVVYNPVKYGTVFMNKYLPETPQYLHKGDVIASVTVESDIMDISRRETTLRRNQERLADLIAENNERNEEQISQMQETIQDQEEELAKRRTDYSTTKIVAPVDGYLEYLYPCSEGEIIKSNTRMAYIADKNALYISMYPERTQYEIIANFGNTLEIDYYDSAGKQHTGLCSAVTLRPELLSPKLSESVLLKPSDETKENMAITNEGTNPAHPTVNSYTVRGVAKDMDNVILVPKAAVTVTTALREKNVGYVDVLQEDGSVIRTPFLLGPWPGGENMEYYWAIEGLTEGMEIICLE